MRASGPILLLATFLATTASPLPAPAFAHEFAVPDRGIVTACWFDTRLFDSLRTGPMTYCRGHLAYSPGALDCYQFTDQVCNVVLPASSTITQTRQSVAPAIFPCPDAPEPPVCPRLGSGLLRNHFE